MRPVAPTIPPRAALSSRSWLRARLAAWRVAEAGVAAVEFALILPVMTTLFFGLNEITLLVAVDRKLGSLSRSLADLSSRANQISTAELANDFDAAVMTMRPYDSTTLQMVVTSVLVTASGSSYKGTVDWSCARHIVTKPATMSQTDYDAANLKVRTKGSTYTVPTGFQTTTTQAFMLVETLLPYQPSFGYFIKSTIALRETSPWPVRGGTGVTGPTSCPS